MAGDHAPANVNKQLRAVPWGDPRDGDKSQPAGLRCFCNGTMNDGGSMSITSAQSYEMRITRKGDKIDPPQPYWQTVERLLADRGIDHVSRLLAYALRDLDQAQGKA
jgi:hypothetical protein